MFLWWLPDSNSLDASARVLSLVNHEIAGARSGFGEVLPQADVRKPLEVLRILIAVGVAIEKYWIRGCGCDGDPSYGVEVRGLG